MSMLIPMANRCRRSHLPCSLRNRERVSCDAQPCGPGHVHATLPPTSMDERRLADLPRPLADHDGGRPRHHGAEFARPEPAHPELPLDEFIHAEQRAHAGAVAVLDPERLALGIVAQDEQRVAGELDHKRVRSLCRDLEPGRARRLGPAQVNADPGLRLLALGHDAQLGARRFADVVLEFLGRCLHHRERLLRRHDHRDRRALADQLGALTR